MAYARKGANTELLKTLHMIFILNLFFFNLSAVGIRYYISYVSFGWTIFILYKVITPLIPVLVCHHANLSRYY